MKKNLLNIKIIAISLIFFSSFFSFAQNVSADTLSIKDVFVAQDVSCDYVEMDGILVGSYTEPISVIYQIGTTKELTAKATLRSVGGEIELSATLTGLKSGYTYNYHFKDSTEYGAPFGYSSFLFKPTKSGCATTPTSLSIENLDYAPEGDTSLKFSGEVTHGLYDAKTFSISIQKLAPSVGPEEAPILKNVIIVSEGGAGENDEFEVSVNNLQPGSYNYSFYDKNHKFITGSSGYFGIDDLTIGTSSVTIIDIKEEVNGVKISGEYPDKTKQDIQIKFGTSPSQFNVKAQSNLGNSDAGFDFNTTGLTANTTYYFQIFDSKGNPLSQVGSFNTLPVSSPVDDGGLDNGNPPGGGSQFSYAPSRYDLFYTPGISTYIKAISVSQTKVTVTGQLLTLNKDVELYLYQVDGDTYTHFQPTINTKNKTFSDEISNLIPNHLYMVYLGNPYDDTNNYSMISYFETLPIVVTPGASSVGGDNATIVANATDGVYTLDVMYGTDSNDLSTEAGMDKNSDGTWSANISDLDSDTTYFYRIKITSSGLYDLPTYSELFEFVTGKTPDDPGTIPYIVGSSSSGSGIDFEAEENGGIIPCTGVNEAGTRTTCTFDHFIKLINNIINLLMFVLAPSLAALMFLYGGFIMLTSTGSPEKVSQAKGIFMKALTGIIIAFCAWIIVKTVMVGMGYNVDYFPTFF